MANKRLLEAIDRADEPELLLSMASYDPALDDVYPDVRAALHPEPPEKDYKSDALVGRGWGVRLHEAVKAGVVGRRNGQKLTPPTCWEEGHVHRERPEPRDADARERPGDPPPGGSPSARSIAIKHRAMPLTKRASMRCGLTSISLLDTHLSRGPGPSIPLEVGHTVPRRRATRARRPRTQCRGCSRSALPLT